MTLSPDSPTSPPSPVSSPSPIKIAIIGDIHNYWSPVDEAILHHLAVDLVLFVGDVGNEDVPLVRSIAALDLPKAVILGNHDAWHTMTQWGRQTCPYDRDRFDWVQDQLDALGECHVGYGKLDFPQFGLSVVGSRPFSWGGPKWRDKTFYQQRYQVGSFAESADLIVAAAQATTHDNLLMIGHNGPTGLGEKPEDPCGKDWAPIGGDYGDPDFAAAISQLQAHRQIPLVTFGHMHHHLRHTSQLRRSALWQGHTLYLNAARTPRIVNQDQENHHYFSLVELREHQVTDAKGIWVRENLEIIAEESLLP
jgi:uncharacterized protein (TIGR04168 family)